VVLTPFGREMRMLVENADDQTEADPSLLRIIARAHHIQARLIQNPKLSVHDIAREERVSAAYIFSLPRLPWLAPDITTAVSCGGFRPLTMAAEVAKMVRDGPALSEHGVVRWRRVDLSLVIEARFGVRLAERSVGDVLRRLGFRRLSARPRHPGHDAAAKAGA
jgi:Winged helix-turn helix